MKLDKPKGGWKRSKFFWGIVGIVVIILIIIGATSEGGEADTTADINTTLATTSITAPGVSTTATMQSPPTSSATSALAADIEYRSKIVEMSKGVSGAMATIGELSSTFPHWSDEDQFRYAGALAMLLVMEDDLKKLTPPPAWQTVHDHLLTAAGYYKDSSRLAAQGIDNLDAAKINLAAELMAKGVAEINTATSLIPN